MKKSLIALASLAFVGAVSAQTVTLSGKLAFGYATTEDAGANPAKANGLTVTDGDFVLAASEDLGGGMKIAASMGVQSRGRDTAIAGRDASLTVSGGFGAVTIGAIEIGNGIIGLGGADAPTIGMDGAQANLSRAVLSAPMNLDVLMYTSPAIGGFTLSAAILDATPDSTGVNKTQTLGMGSTALTQDATLIGVGYAAGPVAAAADYTNFGLNAVPAATPGADTRLRMSASYDLGMAKLGAGYENVKYTDIAKTSETQYLIGVSAPVGKALTVGANYVKNTMDGNVDVSGYELGANYALSKRTGVQVAYQSLSESDANGVVALTGSATTFRVRLMHSF